jgi:hypothetical protein
MHRCAADQVHPRAFLRRYSINVPVADLTDGRAMIALRYDGMPWAT